MYSVMWSEHCSYKSSKVHLRQFGEKAPEDRRACWSASARTPASSTSAQGWAVTFKVESHNHPSLRRALPGRGHRRRRHRARHHLDGRPPGRGDGPAAVRPGRRTRHPPRAARRRRRHRRLRQLPRACPTSAARSSSTRPTRATRWSTRSASASCATTTSSWPTPPAPATWSCCSAPAPAATASAGCRVLASRDLRRRRPDQAARPCRSATRSRRRCSSSAASSSSPPTSSSASRTSAGPGISCATSELASNGDGGMHVWLDRVPLRDATLRARGDPHERVAGAHVRGRRAGQARRVPRDLRASGTSRPP